MYYYLDITDYTTNTLRHIMRPMDDGGIQSFPLTDDNPNTAVYLAWVEEGNVAEEWEGS